MVHERENDHCVHRNNGNFEQLSCCWNHAELPGFLVFVAKSERIIVLSASNLVCFLYSWPTHRCPNQKMELGPSCTLLSTYNQPFCPIPCPIKSLSELVLFPEPSRYILNSLFLVSGQWQESRTDLQFPFYSTLPPKAIIFKSVSLCFLTLKVSLGCSSCS